MAKPLAQVTDVDALDAHDGTCARVTITVPSAWAGATLAIVVPRRMSCERCGGGGCDSCDRSGALRAPDEARELRLTLPCPVGDGALIRVPAPFADPSIEQLIVELKIGELSAGVSRISPPTRALAVVSPSRPPPLVIALALVLVIALGVLITLR